MLDKIFDFEAYTYNFFIFKGFGAFLLTNSMFLLGGGATGKFVVGERETAVEGRVMMEFKIVNFPFEFVELDIKLDVTDSCFL